MADNITVIKDRLTFKQAAKYLMQPILLSEDAPILEEELEVDDVSEISNCFEEFQDESMKIMTLFDLKRKLRTLGKNFKYLDTFTEDFRKLSTDILGETKLLGAEEGAEEEKPVESVLDNNREGTSPSRSLQDDIMNIIFTSSLDLPLYDELVENESFPDEEELSEYWKLLSAYEEFQAIPQNFDEYDFKKNHWLDRPPVSWKLIDESIRKCQDWLDKYCDTSITNS